MRLAGVSGLWQNLGALLLLAKPGIVMAELAAAMTGMLLARPMMPSWATIFWLGIVVVLAASGAAMANNLIEAASDRLMPRLAARCLALTMAGEQVVGVVSTVFMALSLILAATFLNQRVTLFLGVAIASYLWLYTVRQKRNSPLAFLVGGIPGALPPLIGAVAVAPLSPAPLLLSLVIYCWQVPHFLFIALQYQSQYERAGLPVFPLVYGFQPTRYLILASGAILLLMPIAFRLFAATSMVGIAALVIAGGLFIVTSFRSLQQPRRYRQGCFNSMFYLALLLLVLIVDSALHPWD